MPRDFCCCCAADVAVPAGDSIRIVTQHRVVDRDGVRGRLCRGQMAWVYVLGLIRLCCCEGKTWYSSLFVIFILALTTCL